MPTRATSRSADDPSTDLDWERLARTAMHESQLAILRELSGAEMSPNVLAARLGKPLGNVSYHVRRLERYGLIELTRTAQRRGAVEHFYVLADGVARRG